MAQIPGRGNADRAMRQELPNEPTGDTDGELPLLGHLILISKPRVMAGTCAHICGDRVATILSLNPAGVVSGCISIHDLIAAETRSSAAPSMLADFLAPEGGAVSGA